MKKLIDISYGDEFIDGENLLKMGIETVILKASDFQILPNSEGNYEWTYPVHQNYDALNHIDPFFKLRFEHYRSKGMIVGAYHNANFSYIAYMTRAEMVTRQVEYFKRAVVGIMSRQDRPIIHFEGDYKIDRFDIVEMIVGTLKLFTSAFGTSPIIYTTKRFAEKYMLVDNEKADFFISHHLWLSDTRRFIFTPSPPRFEDKIWEWQIWHKQTKPDISVTREDYNMNTFLMPSQLSGTPLEERKQ